MKIWGLSNRLDKNHHLFFYEFDKVKFDDVVKEAVYLSNEFDMNLLVFLSSKDSYHFVSFDVMTTKNVVHIQRNVRILTDYVSLDEQKLFGNWYQDNCLRLSWKGKKAPPVFLFMVQAKTKKHIAVKHLWLYAKITKIPDKLIEFLSSYGCSVPFDVNYVIYNTNTTPRKKWFGCCVRKGEW